MARNNASMVLQTNDFDSCMRAVMWGRNVYMNVQRFLQFQMTANFSVIVVVIVSYITMTQSALNPVQLIYINLIMDIFGALALAATRPQTDLAKVRRWQWQHHDTLHVPPDFRHHDLHDRNHDGRHVLRQEHLRPRL